jgi:hypothetical protein
MAVEGGDRTISDADRSEFTELRITEAPPATIVVAEVLDASQLRGIIAQLQLLGISVVSARRVQE